MTRTIIVSFVLALAGTGCMHAGHAVTAAASASGAPEQNGMGEMCPMSVPGTHVTAADTASGEALTFTTTPDQAAALREKVHAMGDLHNRHGAPGDSGHSGMGGMMGGSMAGGALGGMQMPPPSRATVGDLQDGARLVVTPNDPVDLRRLQSTVQMHAEQMQQHGCAMMGHLHD